MSSRIFHVDSYQKTFNAQVVEHDLELNGIILNQTAFYPGGGGQPADKGVLLFSQNNVCPTSTRSVAGKIIHILPEDTKLPKIGSEITGKIDWPHRFQLMRTHTAMHVLCGVIFRDYGASVTGGNMAPLNGRMDFEFASLHKDLVNVIEQAINLEISKSLPVTWRDIPRKEALQIPDLIRTKINLVPKNIKKIRVVEIEGLDLQADGGTHVSNTSEIGPVKITDYKSKGKENKRIYLELVD
jgi:misacylated tRNA(Ala) deacylase